MKVFISWSGDVSRQIGLAFSNWLPDVMQFVQPYYSPDDIGKGQRWSHEIAENLKTSSVGLICITSDNLLAPWLMFEAGAISRSDLARVCPMLFEVEPSQLTGPLLQFQATPYNKDEVFKLSQTINSLGGSSALSEEHLKRAFDRCWPELEEKIARILSQPKVKSKPAQRSLSELVEETLSLVRVMSSQGENTEPINHWLIIFKAIIDLSKSSLSISDNVEQNAQLKQLIIIHDFLRLTLNLITPKITRASKFKEMMAEGQGAMKALDDRINKLKFILDDDIPF
jgi:hypothetical protein